MVPIVTGVFPCITIALNSNTAPCDISFAPLKDIVTGAGDGVGVGVGVGVGIGVGTGVGVYVGCATDGVAVGAAALAVIGDRVVITWFVPSLYVNVLAVALCGISKAICPVTLSPGFVFVTTLSALLPRNDKEVIS
jgi:hypothetical protein